MRDTILEVADYGGPYSGSYIPSLLRLREFVANRLGLETVFVFSEIAIPRPWTKQMRDSGATLVFLDRRLPRFERVRRLGAIASQQSSVLVHSHFGAFDMEAALVAKLQGAKVVWHAHSLFVDSPQGQRMKGLLHWGLAARFMVDRVVAVSDAVAQVLESAGTPKARIRVVPNGIETSRFAPSGAAKRANLALKYHIPPAARVLLMFGWSPHTKGVDILARAATDVAIRAGSETHYLVVSGENNQQELEQILGNVSTAHVIGPVEDVRELYQLADCFVSASRSEGFSFAIAEAMAASLPIVSSDLPHLVAMYGPAGRGFATFRNGDPQDLARALCQLLCAADDDLRANGHTNRAFVESNFGIERWCSRIADIYESLL